MILTALFGNDCFHGRSQGSLIAGRARANYGEKKVASCHSAQYPIGKSLLFNS